MNLNAINEYKKRAPFSPESLALIEKMRASNHMDYKSPEAQQVFQKPAPGMGEMLPDIIAQITQKAQALPGLLQSMPSYGQGVMKSAMDETNAPPKEVTLAPPAPQVNKTHGGPTTKSGGGKKSGGVDPALLSILDSQSRQYNAPNAGGLGGFGGASNAAPPPASSTFFNPALNQKYGLNQPGQTPPTPVSVAPGSPTGTPAEDYSGLPVGVMPGKQELPAWIKQLMQALSSGGAPSSYQPPAGKTTYF